MKVTHKRLNITLPESTVALLETVANRGERSNFIDTAIREHIKLVRRTDLRHRLKEGAIARSERDTQIAEEWFELENELWQS